MNMNIFTLCPYLQQNFMKFCQDIKEDIYDDQKKPDRLNDGLNDGQHNITYVRTHPNLLHVI